MNIPPLSSDLSTTLRSTHHPLHLALDLCREATTKKQLLFHPGEGAAGGVTVGACSSHGGVGAENVSEAECKGDTLARREVWERHRRG